MYALIESGGQQHKVALGRYVTLKRLPVDEGGQVVFDRVLLVRTDERVALGTPTVDGAEVRGHVRRHLRGKKVHGFKYKAKKGYRRRWGARADLTQVTIESILFEGETFAAEALLDEPTELDAAEAEEEILDDEDDEILDDEDEADDEADEE